MLYITMTRISRKAYRHGELGKYTHRGCRCDICRDAMRQYREDLARRKAEDAAWSAHWFQILQGRKPMPDPLPPAEEIHPMWRARILGKGPSQQEEIALAREAEAEERAERLRRMPSKQCLEALTIGEATYPCERMDVLWGTPHIEHRAEVPGVGTTENIVLGTLSWRVPLSEMTAVPVEPGSLETS